MLSALEQTGDRRAALARFARSVSETEATALRRALEALSQRPARNGSQDAARGDQDTARGSEGTVRGVGE
jgi:hypothetical protein